MFFLVLSYLPIAGVGRPVAGNLLLVAIAHRHQHRLGVVQVTALLPVVLEHARLDDGVDRAGLLAEAAEDALHQVDVVARGAASSILSLFRLNMNSERGTNRLAQLARDAALLAVRVAPQRVQPAEARAHRRFFLRELHRDLAREEMPPGKRHPSE